MIKTLKKLSEKESKNETSYASYHGSMHQGGAIFYLGIYSLLESLCSIKVSEVPACMEVNVRGNRVPDKSKNMFLMEKIQISW